MTITHVLYGLLLLFEHPNPHDPLPNGIDAEWEAANLLRKDPKKFEEMVNRFEGRRFLILDCLIFFSVFLQQHFGRWPRASLEQDLSSVEEAKRKEIKIVKKKYSFPAAAPKG